MQERTIKKHDDFILYVSHISAGQAYVVASVTSSKAGTDDLAAEIYREISNVLKQHDLHIVQERIFGSLLVASEVQTVRESILSQNGLDAETPVTFVQGQPCLGSGLAGVQLRVFHPQLGSDKVWTIRDNHQPAGRAWNRLDNTFIMLQNMRGTPPSPFHLNGRYQQTEEMFNTAQRLLASQGGCFNNVLRTWIYLTDILCWYGEFNQARNSRFKMFDLLRDPQQDNRTAEETIYLPASTGIRGDNIYGASGVMDVFAVVPGESTHVEVQHTSGVKQKSPFRYGSAFSRAMTLREPDVLHILLSGTAAIDEQGASLYSGDPRSQILKTFDIVEALISRHGASMQNIGDATLFFKNPKDLDVYYKIAAENDLEDLAAIYVVADICRDELLFEIDADIAVKA